MARASASRRRNSAKCWLGSIRGRYKWGFGCCSEVFRDLEVSGKSGRKTCFQEDTKQFGDLQVSEQQAYQGNSPMSFKPSSESAAGEPGSGSSCPGNPRQ